MKKLAALLYILVSMVPFVPMFGVLDMVGPQFLYLSCLQFISSIIILLIYKNKNKSIEIQSNFLFLKGLFLIWCFITLITAFNKIESIVTLAQLLTYFLTLLNLYFIHRLNPSSKKLFIGVFLSLLTIEAFYVFYSFASTYDPNISLSRSRNYQGLTSNLNVTAFSILVKLPILLYQSTITKRLILKGVYFFIALIAIFDLLIVSSRGAILALFLISGLLFLFYPLFWKTQNSKKYIRGIIVFAGLIISMIIFQTNLYKRVNSGFEVIGRVSNFDDSSTQFRLGYYQDALNAILSKPILGEGIGNWKIKSIDYVKFEMEEYQVPYNAHNDFLQIGAETGVVGFLLYLGLFIYLGILLLKKILLGNNDEEKIFSVFLLCSLIAYGIDSSLNFPMTRPISLMNLLFLTVAILDFEKPSKFNFQVKIPYQFIVLFLSIATIFSNYKVFKSLQEQVVMFVEFNILHEYKAPLEIIKGFNDSYPTLTATAMPLKNAKANYYIRDKKYDEAIDLIKSGQKDNPYLSIGEHQLAKIYRDLNLIDSARIYAKKSFDNLPFNPSHATTYQSILYDLREFEEMERIFKIYAPKKNEIFWQNHLLAISALKQNDKFTNQDKQILDEALGYFPNNKVILQSEKIIKYGVDIITLANEIDSQAQEFYKNKKYEEAIHLWNKCKQIITTEDSYFLNIAQAYTSMEKYEQSLNELNKLLQLGISENRGKLEFLKAMNFLGQKKSALMCKNLKISKKKGYLKAGDILKQFSCN